jgi:hypothetical protein
MAAGKHIGKVIIKIRDEMNPSKLQMGLPRFYCFENSSYIVLGGLGGFGLELGNPRPFFLNFISITATGSLFFKQIYNILHSTCF